MNYSIYMHCAKKRDNPPEEPPSTESEPIDWPIVQEPPENE